MDIRNYLITPEKQRKVQEILHHEPLKAKDVIKSLKLLAGMQHMQGHIENSNKLIEKVDRLEARDKRSPPIQSLYDLGAGMHHIGKSDKAVALIEKVIAMDKEPKHILEDHILLSEAYYNIPAERGKAHHHALQAYRMSSELYGKYDTRTVILIEKLPSLQSTTALSMERFRTRARSASPRITRLQVKEWKY
eukprot:PhF_6_TR28794/c0_g1_i1/m.42173